MPLQGEQEHFAAFLEAFELLSLEDRAGVAFDLIVFGTAMLTPDGRRIDPRDTPDELCTAVGVSKWWVREVGAHGLVIAPGRQAQIPDLLPEIGTTVGGSMKIIKCREGWRAEQSPFIAEGASMVVKGVSYIVEGVVLHLDGTVSFDLEPVGV